MASDTNSDELSDRIDALQPQDFGKALESFKENLHHDYAAYLQSCVRCGLCADSCHYHLATGDAESIPAHKLNLVAKVFKRHFTWAGKKAPKWFGGEKLDEAMVREWIDSLYGRCTLCGRCSLNCTMGINIPYLIRAARTALKSVGLVPPELQATVDNALTTGNNMAIEKEDWIETVEWLQDELQAETGSDEARLPLNVKGARNLYTVNPREAMFFPLSIVAVGKIFHAAGEDWTLSSDEYDVTNYGLYNGDDEEAAVIADRLVQGVEKLGCERLILGECGHGFNSNRWEGPEWRGKTDGFEMKSILEVVAGYLREGRIKLDPSKNQQVVTLHDPCNLVRHGGIVEEQRYLLRHAVENFVEMSPNREKNFCCGGGGGQLAMTRFADRRLEAGKIKAQQIERTGAQIVVSPCHNCVDQLSELSKHYELGFETKTVCEIVANAIVL